ncbi:hypothetical protein GGI23_007132, partial [Coemansia sp. RSA 2559]
MSIKEYLQTHEQKLQQQQQQQRDKHNHGHGSQAHLGLGLDTPPLTAETSSGTSSTRSSTATNNSNTNSIVPASNAASATARPKTPSIVDVARSFMGSDILRRKRTIERKPAAPPAIPAPSGRRTTLTVPSAFQPSVHEIANTRAPSLYGEDLNIPPSPPKKSETALASSGTIKSRRHTHNFFSSSGTASLDTFEPRRSTESVRSSFRMTREIQMKDLPPLPQKAVELIQGVKGALDPRGRIIHDAAPGVGKKPGNIPHFSSHAELIQRSATAIDKPRSSSLTADALDKLRGRPNTSASIVTEVQPSKNSQSRDSGSTEIRLTITYNWRPVPEDGDISWGFSVSPLAMRKPNGRKKSAAAHMVVHSHEPTMNRRRLPTPQKDDTPLAKGAAPARPKTPMPDALRNTDADQISKDKQGPQTPMPKKDKQAASQAPPPPQPKDKDVPPELPKAKMPQGE